MYEYFFFTDEALSIMFSVFYIYFDIRLFSLLDE